MTSRRRAFTMVELLVVIGIIALLAAILFPVFAAARGKARQASCLSNLKQIGVGIQMYTQDYDGLMPYAKDASDAYVPQMWQPAGCNSRILEMPFLHPTPAPTRIVVTSGVGEAGVLDPYIKNNQVWQCMADTGFDYLDNNSSCDGPCPLDARPTMFKKYGASYLYRTELAFRHINVDAVSAVRRGGADAGPADINVLFDGAGSWHGGLFPLGRQALRYNVVFADGHAKLLTYDAYQAAWSILLGEPGSSPCQQP